MWNDIIAEYNLRAENTLLFMEVFIYCKITLHVSSVNRTHHQEYIKL